jgi:hypothetical protein
LGKVKLDGLRPAHLSAFYPDRHGAGLSAYLVRYLEVEPQLIKYLQKRRAHQAQYESTQHAPRGWQTQQARDRWAAPRRSG